MSNSSRRGFLKVAGAGAAVAGVAVVTPKALADDAPKSTTEAVALPRSAKGSIVAHVHDVQTGQVSLMVEGHEVTVTDHELVARIATALHKNAPRSVNNPAV